MPTPTLLIYLLRRDLRLKDNPIFHEIAKCKDDPYTHLLPLYVFPAQQLEVSGFIPEDSEEKSPYPEARSAIGGFWRCGPHRAKFLSESVWDLKECLEDVGSGLEIRVGLQGEVISKILDSLAKNDTQMKIGGVWMTAEEGTEEKREERDVKRACELAGVELKLFIDEKYYIDEYVSSSFLDSYTYHVSAKPIILNKYLLIIIFFSRDVPFKDPDDLPKSFTAYRKIVEPLREAPHPVLPTPDKSSLPPLPPKSSIPPQHSPFIIPSSYEDLEAALLSPVKDFQIPNPPAFPEGTQSAHPFRGGARPAQERLNHLVSSGIVSTYSNTRNGLLGLDFSTKLSAWLALGCITARQVHEALLDFEDGKSDLGADQEGYGKGQNDGTKAIRFELVWRDYMRLCNRKYGPRLFRQSGFREDFSYPWKSPQNPREVSSAEVKRILERILNGTTGMGIIDASQREVYHTGYTSNRARQNVASFLTRHMGLDWRLGAEWYECCLVDYDLSSNWGNWQYVGGVGTDPRDSRMFNPVKQAHEYDPRAEYVKAWVPELRAVEEPAHAFQAWEVPEARRAELGLAGLEWVENPLKKINFVVGHRPRSSTGNQRRSAQPRSGGGRGGGGGSTDSGHGGHQQHRETQYRGNGQGYSHRRGGGGAYGGSSRGHQGAGGGRYPGREGRMGMMERDAQARQNSGFLTEQV